MGTNPKYHYETVLNKRHHSSPRLFASRLMGRCMWISLERAGRDVAGLCAPSLGAMLADLLSEGATPVANSRFQRGRPQVSPVTLAFCAKSVHSWPPTGRHRFFLACAIVFLVVEEVCAAESVVMISWFYLRRDISTSKAAFLTSPASAIHTCGPRWTESRPRDPLWAALKVPQ